MHTPLHQIYQTITSRNRLYLWHRTCKGFEIAIPILRVNSSPSVHCFILKSSKLEKREGGEGLPTRCWHKFRLLTPETCVNSYHLVRSPVGFDYPIKGFSKIMFITLTYTQESKGISLCLKRNCCKSGFQWRGWVCWSKTESTASLTLTTANTNSPRRSHLTMHALRGWCTDRVCVGSLVENLVLPLMLWTLISNLYSKASGKRKELHGG